MNSRTARKLAPFIQDEQRIDVSVEDGITEIHLSTWVEGLGWTGQKTMRLEANMVEDLHRALAAARCKLDREEGSGENGNVIEFPAVSG